MTNSEFQIVLKVSNLVEISNLDFIKSFTEAFRQVQKKYPTLGKILTRENIIMSQLVQLRAIKQRLEASEEEDAREILLTVAESAKIPDPFDEDEKKEMEKIGYKRHEVPDKMPDFK